MSAWYNYVSRYSRGTFETIDFWGFGVVGYEHFWHLTKQAIKTINVKVKGLEKSEQNQ